VWNGSEPCGHREDLCKTITWYSIWLASKPVELTPGPCVHAVPKGPIDRVGHAVPSLWWCQHASESWRYQKKNTRPGGHPELWPEPRKPRCRSPGQRWCKMPEQQRIHRFAPDRLQWDIHGRPSAITCQTRRAFLTMKLELGKQQSGNPIRD
jgi:hypothetical protein